MKNDIFAAGVIIMVAAVLLVLVVTTVDNGGREYDEAHTLAFEDYRPIDPAGILGTDGSIEIVKVNGASYIHAKGTGQGAIVKENGTTERYWVEHAITDLLIMDGQSNAAYHRPDAAQAIAPDLGSAFYFGYPDGMPSGLTEDVSGCGWYDFLDRGGTLRVGDKGPAACRAYTEATGHKAAWISLGIPGHSILEWDKGQPCWNQNIAVMDAALGSIPDGFRIDRIYVMWAQGESDYLMGTGYQSYVDRFIRFHDAAPSAWGTKIDGWLLIPGNDTNMGAINGALKDIASRLNDTDIAPDLASTFTTDNLLMGSDALHYTQLGDNAIGASAGRQLSKAQDRAPIYLQQSVVDCDTGAAVALGPCTGYDVDGKERKLATTWAGSPDTAAPGIQTIGGTTSLPSLLLQGCPAPIAIIRVGYVGFSDGIEYIKNAGGGLTVIGRDSAALGDTLTIPEAVGGLNVTAIADNALRRGCWHDIAIPDSMAEIGAYGLYSTPYLHTITIGDGLTTAPSSAFSVTFMKDGAAVAWAQDPAALAGVWEWDGHTRGTMYYQGEAA